MEENKQLKRSEIFNPDFFWVMVAGSRGGKTYMMNEILTDDKYGIFHWIKPSEVFIVSPTVKIHPETGKNYLKDKSYKKLFAKLTADKDFDPQINLIGEQNFNNVQKIMQQHMQNNIYLDSRGIENHTLFILDDCLNKLGLDDKRSLVANLSTEGRHYNMSVITPVQDLKGVAKRIRRNANHISVFTLDDGDDYKTLVNERRGKMDKSDFDSIYKYCTQDPFSYLHIKRQEGGLSLYFKNLKEQIDV